MNTQSVTQVILLLTLLGTSNSFAQQKWYEKTKLGGDFRYRHERLDQNQLEGTEHRQRIRARLSIDAQVNDKVQAIFQLASGSPSESRSTNQTLEGKNKKKEFNLDMAYINWMASQSIRVLAGKVKNTLYTPGESDLLWDSDLTFDGITFNFNNSSNRAFINLGAYWYENENTEKSSASDVYQYASQIGFNFGADDNELILGAGYHAFTPIAGRAAVDANGNDIAFGNSVQNDKFIYDYLLAQAFINYSVRIFTTQITTYVDYVQNSDPDNNNRAYLVGVSFGDLRDVYNWTLGYNYRFIESDGLMAAFTDGDVANGESNSDAHKIQIKIKLADGVISTLTHYEALRNLTSNEDKYRRSQLDFSFSF